jgi:nucleoid-associated protein YgaU
MGTLLPFIGRAKLAQGTSSTATLTKAAMPTYSADPQDTGSEQLLTVVARSGQTLEDLSLLYAGDFDRDLFEKICRLNPQLKDANHLEAGQLILIPLPPRTLRRVVVRAEGTSTPTDHF